jgi:hypothetical protein
VRQGRFKIDRRGLDAGVEPTPRSLPALQRHLCWASRRCSGLRRPSRAPALIGATFGTYTVGEHLGLGSASSVRARDAVLADRNFLSHTLAHDVLATGAHLLWRASASFRLALIR